MGKNKKQSPKESAAEDKPAAAGSVQPQAEATDPVADASLPTHGPDKPLPKSRLRRLLPDLIKALLALAVIALAVAIWFKPPLVRISFPYVTYRFGGKTYTDATLYRPLAMPTRYYVQLPRQLAGRYTWFAVDRRREVAALAEAPTHLFFGQSAIKRSDPLGLDLEFRKLDHSEWQVHFFEDAIVFSNSVLSISLDTTNSNDNRGN